MEGMIMRSLSVSFAVFSVLLTGILPISAAASNGVLVYEGQITDASMTPVDGVHELRMNYFKPGQSQPLYQESVAGVPFREGHFEVKLGAGTKLPGSSLASLGEAFSTFPKIEMELVLDGKVQKPRMTIRPAGFSQADLATLAGHASVVGEKHWEGYRVPSSGTAVQAVVFRPADSKVLESSLESNPYLLEMNYLGISPAVRD